MLKSSSLFEQWLRIYCIPCTNIVIPLHNVWHHQFYWPFNCGHSELALHTKVCSVTPIHIVLWCLHSVQYTCRSSKNVTCHFFLCALLCAPPILSHHISSHRPVCCKSTTCLTMSILYESHFQNLWTNFPHHFWVPPVCEKHGGEEMSVITLAHTCTCTSIFWRQNRMKVISGWYSCTKFQLTLP